MTMLPDFNKLLKQREHWLQERAKAYKEVRDCDAEVRRITKKLSEKCLYDGHDWKLTSWGSHGHYWDCKICYSAAPGRHYKKPDPWFAIPRQKRRRKPGKQLKVRHYPNGEVEVLDDE